MGHLAGKDLYRELGGKLDGLSCRAPWNETLREILKGLYSEEEAELLILMPASASTAAGIAAAAGIPEPRVQNLLEGMAGKGLVVDLKLADESYFMPAPMVIGFFEFTMMRAGAGAATGERPAGPDAQQSPAPAGVDVKKMARLFHDYMEEGGLFYKANFSGGEKVSVMRALPHEGTVAPEQAMEVLDYEKASAIAQAGGRAAFGACACRHKASHLGEESCSAPPGVCTSFGYAADFLVRRGLAREASTSEVLDSLARSRDLGLVLNADNVQKGVTFICHCCKCCCLALRGISTHGYANAVVTSNFICEVEAQSCTGCGRCVEACPIDAIKLAPRPKASGAAAFPETKSRPLAFVDEALCLGCGVCVLKCAPRSARLTRRGQRVLHPETTFRKIILSSLERGTLQNQLFSDPGSLSQEFMRGVVGAFLGLAPVKKALMSDVLRSAFLKSLEAGARAKGDGWATEL